jgi:hypothetical protein
MSDADYEIEKGTIASAVVPLGQKKNPGAARWKIRHYVLNPGLLDVMTARATGKEPSEPTAKPVSFCYQPGLQAQQLVRTAMVLHGLDLTPEQTKAVLTVVRSAVDTKSKVEKEIEQVMSEADLPYAALRRELALGQPTKKGERMANMMHGRVKRLRDDKLRKELLSYEAELDKILPASQVAFLSADPKDDPSAPPARREGIDRTMNQAKRVLSDARRMSTSAFGKEREAMLRRLIRAALDVQGVEAKSVNMDEEIKRGIGILEEARKMGTSEYASKREDLAASLLPRRSTPRPATYGRKYHRGQPLAMLSPSSRLLFTETACKILEKMVE